MAVRIRVTGEIICAAKSDPQTGDIYVPDGLHYELSVIQKVLIPDKNEDSNGRWYWLHGECDVADHPQDASEGSFCRVELAPRRTILTQTTTMTAQTTTPSP